MKRREALQALAAVAVALPALADPTTKKEKKMVHELPPLSYPKDALAPIISAETLEFHHDKHHAAYVANLNTLKAGSEFETSPLEEIVKKSSGAIFNNAAQVYNHTFYFNCLSPKSSAPSAALLASLEKTFGSKAAFIEKFNKSAVGNFGSGWTWLVKNQDGSLEILNTSNAATPLTQGKTPLFTLDVWEHAYYIDYRNARAKYCEKIWEIVNWEFVSKNFAV